MSDDGSLDDCDMYGRGMVSTQRAASSDRRMSIILKEKGMVGVVVDMYIVRCVVIYVFRGHTTQRQRRARSWLVLSVD